MESRKEVSAALDRILETPAFLRSPRLAQFLRFAVEQRLSERADSPKESEIGVQVFGRPADYDCRIDPVVRVQARQLRFKLHEYYETVGKDDPFRIELPKGAYLASFCGETARELVPAGPIRRSVQLRWIVAAAAIAMIAVSRGAWREAARRAWAKTLPAQPKSAQSTAAELYLRGRYYWSKRTPEDLPKAVELDDSLAEAHSSLGFALFYGYLDLKGGEREFKRAVELNPNYAEAHHWYGTALMTLDRPAEASEELARARELEPSSRSILADQGLALFYAGKRAQAIEQLQQIEAAQPSFRSAHLYLAYIYFNSQEVQNYLMEARQAAESSHDPVELEIVKEAKQGFASGGRPGTLQGLLNAQKRFNGEGRYPAFQVAETNALMGNKDQALKYLQSSYDKREVNAAAVSVAPAFSDLRGEPRYRRLMAELGQDVPK